MQDMSLFTAEQVSKLARLSLRQLSYWDSTDFFSPCLEGSRRHPFARVYSFRDVVSLRTISILRNKYGIPLQELRKLSAWLCAHYDAPWSSLRFFVLGRRVFFDDPATGARITSRPRGQVALPIYMEPIAHEVQADIRRMSQRQTEDYGKISQNRYVAHNAPVIAGTRIPTSAIWHFHCAGYGTPAIIREYPRLSELDIRAAITYEEEKRQERAS